jgi:hypothetical protein
MDGRSGGSNCLQCQGWERLPGWSACWSECGSMEVWRSGSGNGVWLFPPTKEVAESGDSMELGIAGGGGSIGDGVGDGIEAVDNGVGWCDSQDGEIVVMEVDCVGDVEGLGFRMDNTMTEVMLEGDADVESVRATESPGVAGAWRVVDDDGAAKWQERGGIVVEGAIEVCPGWHAWRDRELVEEVEC